MLNILKEITAAQWITIGVAAIAPVISFLGVLYTNHTTKKIARGNIDANITANARIEWIQNVRKETAKLISVYHKFLQESNINKKYDFLLVSKESTNLLITRRFPLHTHR